MKKMINLTMKPLILCCCALAFLIIPVFAQSSDNNLWVDYQGGQGPGEGKHIVFVSGDEEYRSEEALPALAKILAYRHGFTCTVLFAINPETGEIDPNYQENIPGIDKLQDADLMVLFTRFRALPEEQMKHVLDYVNAGKPIVGMRTSTHAFQYEQGSPYFKYSAESDVKGWEGGFGRQVLGETWISHHGNHGSESTRGLINGLLEDHPILKDVEDVWGPTDVYGITDITGDEKVLLYGQSLLGMKPEALPNFSKSILPVAWIKDYTAESGKTSRVFNTTMGAATDLESEGMRRLLVNAAYWCMGMEDQIPRESNVEPVGEYQPTAFGFDGFQKGLIPSDFRIDQQTAERIRQEEASKPTAASTAGTWDYEIKIPDEEQKGTLTLKNNSSDLEGSMEGDMVNSELNSFSYENGHLMFDAHGEEVGPVKADLKFEGDRFEGTLLIVQYNFEAPIEGTRRNDGNAKK